MKDTIKIENLQMDFDFGTDVKVARILEQSRLTGQRIRIFYGDTETGRDWLEEYDVIGKVGRSTGTFKIPLLINNSRSLGGGSISTNRILRIIDVKTKRELYKHEKYVTPILVQCESQNPEYAIEIRNALKDNEVHARFKTVGSAARWLDFMHGKRMCK